MRVGRKHRQGKGGAEEHELQEGVILRHRCRVDFSTWQREVPVPHEGLGRRQRSVAVVESCDGQAGIAAENESSKRGRDQTFDAESGGHDDHEAFVSHWVHDRSRDGLLLPFSGKVAIDEVGDSGIGEEKESRGVVVVQEEVGSCWSGDEAGCCQEVGNVVDVFICRTSAAGEGGANGGGGRFGALTGSFEGGF